LESSEVVQRHRMDRRYSGRLLAPEASGQAIAGGAVTACEARGCAATSDLASEADVGRPGSDQALEQSRVVVCVTARVPCPIRSR
jgi:hypothetical protein